MTYRYSGVRLFAHPWTTCAAAASSSSTTIAQPQSVVRPFQILYALNSHMRAMAQSALHSTYQLPTDPPDARDPSGAEFNLTLINYLDPRTHRLPLRMEPYYQMGPLAVGWHRDESLEDLSSIAVYHSSEEADVSKQESSADEYWHIAMKRAWDIETPAIRMALHSGDSYVMAYDLNTTHQHAVLAGTGKRFSSTHRRAKKDRDTLSYITQRSRDVLDASSVVHTHGDVTVALVQQLLEVSDELEFEWLRQFWIQGQRHARNHAYYWRSHIERLEAEWREMQAKIAWVYHQLANYHFSSPTAAVALDLSLCRLLLSSFRATAALRHQWQVRYEQDAYYPSPAQRDVLLASAASTNDDDIDKHEDEPMVRPTFAQDAPMPHDLTSHLSHLQAWEEEFAQLHAHVQTSSTASK